MERAFDCTGRVTIEPGRVVCEDNVQKHRTARRKSGLSRRAD
jgi:hypothetical protein